MKRLITWTLLISLLAVPLLIGSADPDTGNNGYASMGTGYVVKVGMRDNPYRLRMPMMTDTSISLRQYVIDFLLTNAGTENNPPAFGEYYVFVTEYGATFLVDWEGGAVGVTQL